MSNLIDRQKLLDLLAKTPGVGNRALDRVRELPGTCCVDLVRCSDCKHYDTHDHRCKFWNHGVMKSDFCSYAERKET